MLLTEESSSQRYDERFLSSFEAVANAIAEANDNEKSSLSGRLSEVDAPIQELKRGQLTMMTMLEKALQVLFRRRRALEGGWENAEDITYS